VRTNLPYDMSYGDIESLWTRIVCPTLLVYARRAGLPIREGRPVKYFKTSQVVEFDRAGHWVPP